MDFLKRLCPLKKCTDKSIFNKTDAIDIIISDELNDECIICLECHSKDKTSTILKCGHSFHSSCIYEWFIYSKSTHCPICNTFIKI